MFIKFVKFNKKFVNFYMLYFSNKLYATDNLILKLMNSAICKRVLEKDIFKEWSKILDHSFNNISGAIPSCMDNFTSMVRKEEYHSLLIGPSYLGRFAPYVFLYDVLEMWKGIEHHFGRNVEFLQLIDLSRNKLIGEIPKELTNLLELIQLNL